MKLAKSKKHVILRMIDEGHATTQIAFATNTEPAVIREVRSAKQAAKACLKGGADSKVVYANFRDMLTRKECGALR